MPSGKRADKKYGAVGYPMVMTALSGIEVLGALTSRSTFNRDNGAARFGEFWETTSTQIARLWEGAIQSPMSSYVTPWRTRT